MDYLRSRPAKAAAQPKPPPPLEDLPTPAPPSQPPARTPTTGRSQLPPPSVPRGK